ncbi:hypothetical protein [Pedobacter cryoconitis]|uniref:Uncharacterized protein n=1 Tax=Pedobacter cryoconitis TaxID=188932 RepID=A0A7X0MJF6_9SPHI|nr:hypothetical protein [Pedobacter cryoconitis]MBB6501109.1 hypothetical protein [Pedobacter cryoconitis]
MEFEEIEPDSWNRENDFANIHVHMADGRHYGINVWTFNALETSIALDLGGKSNSNGLYVIPPDLFVRELTKECIYETISDLLKKGDLEKVLNPSVLSLKVNGI